MRRDFDPSRTVRTFAAQPRLGPGMSPTSVQVVWQTVTPPMTAQPPRVMSAVRNTGVFAGLSGCGCGGRG